MLIHIYGLTDMTLSLNSIGSTLRGKSRLNNVQVSNEQLRSLEPLAQRGWIELVSAEPVQPSVVPTEEPLPPSGETISVQTKQTVAHVTPVNELVAGDIMENQEATIVDASGKVSKRKMANNASVKPAPESTETNAAVRASLSTQAKLEKDAAEDAASDDDDVDESLLDESEKSGQEVVIASGTGKTTKVKMGKKPPKLQMIKPDDSPFIPPEEYGQKAPTASDIMVDNDGNPVSVDDDGEDGDDKFIE